MISITNAYLWTSSEQDIFIDYHTGDLLWLPPIILGDINDMFEANLEVMI